MVKIHPPQPTESITRISWPRTALGVDIPNAEQQLLSYESQILEALDDRLPVKLKAVAFNYLGVQHDVTAILHPLRFKTQLAGQTVACGDLIVEYKLYAEDMATVVSSLRISADDIIGALFPAK